MKSNAKILFLILASLISALYIPCYRWTDAYAGQYFVRYPLTMVQCGFPIIFGLLLGLQRFDNEAHTPKLTALLAILAIVNIVIVLLVYRSTFQLSIFNLLLAAYLAAKAVSMMRML